ncbi:MAG: tyrosine-protein phosphatase [Burkholderiaceae bacterium]|nr:tyrosine-protein phosphatase [Burkholderiaceae bacterium]
MLFRRLPLPVEVPGALWLHSMPGRMEPWDRFLTDMRRAKLSLVMCLNPLDEVAQLSPEYHKAITLGRVPFRWLHLPMRDMGLATDAASFREGVDQLSQALRLGDHALLHCAAGIGRTGTVAACVLKSLGVPSEQALLQVRQAGANPQTAAQSGLIEQF